MAWVGEKGPPWSPEAVGGESGDMAKLGVNKVKFALSAKRVSLRVTLTM